MSGGNDTEESIKKYTRKDLEALLKLVMLVRQRLCEL